FHALKARQRADTIPTASRVNLLNWDTAAGEPPAGVFPPRPGEPGYGEGPEASRGDEHGGDEHR
ncbi:MAG: hypothetical protein J0H73_13080, partial [Salana multivorans]|nr:hypothetical protein [Salana multivorans]